MSDSEDESIEKQLKVVFLGEANVGKTSIIRRFCFDEFSRQYFQTVGADFYIKRIVLQGKREITLKISDIGGLELNGSMLDKYLFNSNIIVLVYDITNPASFDYMNVWIQTISNLIDSPPITAAIGNKCDLEHQRAVRLDKTQQFVRDYELLTYLVSAKTGEAVNASIVELVAKYLRIPLTKLEKEHQQPIVKAELVPYPPEVARIPSTSQQNSSVCVLQ